MTTIGLIVIGICRRENTRKRISRLSQFYYGIMGLFLQRHTAHNSIEDQDFNDIFGTFECGESSAYNV